MPFVLLLAMEPTEGEVVDIWLWLVFSTWPFSTGAEAPVTAEYEDVVRGLKG